jgi:hypothetical protein
MKADLMELSAQRELYHVTGGSRILTLEKLMGTWRTVSHSPFRGPTTKLLYNMHFRHITEAIDYYWKSGF